MIPYLNDRICLNVLAGSLENAVEIYKAAKGHVVVGVLSKNYDTTDHAIEDMARYMDVLEGNVSIGLGAGDAKQCYAVSAIAKEIKAHHVNQVFTYVGNTRESIANATSHINALVSPTGTPGLVQISTGPLSSSEVPAVVPIATAIAMIKDMGGNAIKFFPMGGLKAVDELKAVAQACADADFVLEPTGGIDLENFVPIMKIILEAGVSKVIPHVYSSIIGDDGNTRIGDVELLYSYIETL